MPFDRSCLGLRRGEKQLSLRHVLNELAEEAHHIATCQGGRQRASTCITASRANASWTSSTSASLPDHPATVPHECGSRSLSAV
jgi:hypothetical protein